MDEPTFTVENCTAISTNTHGYLLPKREPQIVLFDNERRYMMRVEIDDAACLFVDHSDQPGHVRFGVSYFDGAETHTVSRDIDERAARMIAAEILAHLD